jgi:hypothetical protein
MVCYLQWFILNGSNDKFLQVIYVNGCSHVELFV